MLMYWYKRRRQTYHEIEEQEKTWRITVRFPKTRPTTAAVSTQLHSPMLIGLKKVFRGNDAAAAKVLRHHDC